MEAAVDDLVINQFKQIVEIASTALQNATAEEGEDTKAMQKSAKNLMKAGERALQLIEPPCRSHAQQYGNVFVDALRQNDEIGDLRTELTSAIWDVDECTEVDDFDASKFADLQALLKKAALRIVEAIRRMRLGAAPQDELQRTESLNTELPSPAVTPGLNETLSRELKVPARDERASVTSIYSTDGNNEINPITAQAGYDTGLTDVPATRLAQAQSPTAAHLQTTPSCETTSAIAEEEMPPEPSMNPWQLQRKNISQPLSQEDADEPVSERRESLAQASRENSVKSDSRPEIPPMSQLRPGRLDAGVDRMIKEVKNAVQKLTVDSTLPSSNGLLAPSMNLDATSRAAVDGHRQGSISESPVIPPQRWSRASSAGSYQQSVSSGQAARDSLVSPATTDNRFSTFSNPGEVSPIIGRENSVKKPQSPAEVTANFAPWTQPRLSLGMNNPGDGMNNRGPHQDPPTSDVASQVDVRGSYIQRPLQAPQEQPGLELADGQSQPVMPNQLIDHGLIPVDPDRTLETIPERAPRVVDLSILPTSSFNQLKGFCEGAQQVIRGGMGIKRVRQPLGLHGGMEVAKCTGKDCSFELPWEEVKADLNRQGTANHRLSGIRFRSRFLSKSHIRAKTMTDTLYGCLFCYQARHTVEEGDATVFFSREQLFAHLARHPRPLPPILGLTVIDGPTLPPTAVDDYDLQFLEPPAESMYRSDRLRKKIAALPTATATETVMPGQANYKVCPDKSLTTLNFAIGAKLLGVEFPDRFEARWATGWADQTFGAFLAEHIKLDPPPPDEIRSHTYDRSTYSSMVRWRFSQKDKDRGGDWLELKKGEPIHNISWVYPEHWCWSGTNAKGKWGIFPRSHLDPNSQRESTTSSDRASIISGESKSPGKLSWGSLRRGGSRSSGGGNTLTSPHPILY